jgi:hypothetical protein
MCARERDAKVFFFSITNTANLKINKKNKKTYTLHDAVQAQIKVTSATAIQLRAYIDHPAARPVAPITGCRDLVRPQGMRYLAQIR